VDGLRPGPWRWARAAPGFRERLRRVRAPPAAEARRRRAHGLGRSPSTFIPKGSRHQAEGLFADPGRRPVHGLAPQARPPPQAVHVHLSSRPAVPIAAHQLLQSRLHLGSRHERKKPRTSLRRGPWTACSSPLGGALALWYIVGACRALRTSEKLREPTLRFVYFGRASKKRKLMPTPSFGIRFRLMSVPNSFGD
jgi:hypothetical protein